MRIVIFGLAISSSWGNGHATLWRGLIRALTAKRCQVVFYERDVAYYAAHRDLIEIPGFELVLYSAWDEIDEAAKHDIASADVAIVTSYCPDALTVTDLIADAARPIRIFYDLDTPVTLARLDAGEGVAYVGPRLLSDFDLVLSFTGGGALDALSRRLGARRVAPLYGHVDPDVYVRARHVQRYAADLSYLGTYARDRQSQLDRLFVRTAARLTDRRFVIGGAQYPHDFPWHPNIWFLRHLPPSEHAAFYSSSRLSLNVTRQAMARMGWCPSGRLFEAGACAAPIISDDWIGLGDFFHEGSEIIIARATDDVVDALDASDAELRRIGAAARERTLAMHTSAHRAAELLSLLSTRVGQPVSKKEAQNA